MDDDIRSPMPPSPERIAVSIQQHLSSPPTQFGSPIVSHRVDQTSLQSIATSGPGEASPTSVGAMDAEKMRGAEVAARLMSLTAHDLRAPLTTIREAVRLVRDGDLGQLSSTQTEILSAAMNQCDCVNQLVDEMVQSGRFETGFPNARRRWVDIDQLKQSVEDTLQPFVLPRDIHLLWDGPFGRGEAIFGDPILLRRLIVNLATNAVRETRDGQPVLIRATKDGQRDSMQWSIVDQGAGISASDMQMIASGHSPSHRVGGLGLLISRQLAALHFSTLRIESRLGTGTAVSFSTPAGGPAAVAAAWSRWRARLCYRSQGAVQDQSRVVSSVLSPDVSSQGEIQLPRRVRIDMPSFSVNLGIEGHRPMSPATLVLTTAKMGAAVNSAGCDAFDALVSRSLRITELAYRVGRRSWVFAWDTDRNGAIAQREALQQLVESELSSVRLSWGDLNVVQSERDDIALTEASLANRLGDLFVRQSLAVSKQSFADSNQVRLGTMPLQPSARAASRLEREIRRLRRG